MPPFLTVAIPHYKNRRHLEAVLQSVAAQQYDDFEIVVSNDASPDDSDQIIPPLLERTGRPFRYYTQATNLGYDGNVRFCLRSAAATYVLLLGNDDALAGPDTLAELDRKLRELDQPEVAFANYSDWATGALVRRALETRVLGAGPDAALRFFRSFSFVSGLVFRRDTAIRHETDRWDRSIYYQIYLACRVLADGGRLGAIDLEAVRKDVRIDGKGVANYVSRWSGVPWSFEPRQTGLTSVLRVTADAILPFLPEHQRSTALRRILTQVLSVPYPHWLLEYRRVANWSFSVGVARDLYPPALFDDHALDPLDRAYIWAVWATVTAAGLSIPVRLFDPLRDRLASAVRRIQQR
jgi:glycosyltransferase involved in cell wall biosynthesis